MYQVNNKRVHETNKASYYIYDSLLAVAGNIRKRSNCHPHNICCHTRRILEKPPPPFLAAKTNVSLFRFQHRSNTSLVHTFAPSSAAIRGVAVLYCIALCCPLFSIQYRKPARFSFVCVRRARRALACLRFVCVFGSNKQTDTTPHTQSIHHPSRGAVFKDPTAVLSI